MMANVMREPKPAVAGARGLVVALALACAACALGPPTAIAGVVGQWDFANGWNSSNGLIPAVSGISGLSLSYLPKTEYYQYPQAKSQPNPPQLQFATTGSFGIAMRL